LARSKYYNIINIIILFINHIICILITYIFLCIQDDPDIRKRVKIAVSLLVGAKVLNVFVPFIFKYAIDILNTYTTATTGSAIIGLTTAPMTIATAAISLLVGCKNIS